MPTFLQSNFNGEWSPLMLGRVELQRYATACRTMVNFAPTITGGARKRPGLEYIGSTNGGAEKTRLEAFTFSNDDTFLLEWSDNLVRFRDEGATLLLDTEVTPYSEDQVMDLRMTAANDFVFIAHPEHFPRFLTRDASDQWTLQEMPIDVENEPFDITQNTDITLTPSADTGNITLTASDDFFTSDMVGSKFWLGYVAPRQDDRTTINDTIDVVPKTWGGSLLCNVGDIIADGDSLFRCHTGFTSPAGNPDINDYIPSNFDVGLVAKDSTGTELDFPVYGEWIITTSGTWQGTWGIQRSYDDGATWEDLYTLQSNDDANFIREGDETTDPARIRLILFSCPSGGYNQPDSVTYVRQEAHRLGYVEITGYTSPTVVDATVIAGELIGTGATLLWGENEWNPRKGYPSVVFFKNQRLCWASTKAEGQAIWASRTDKWFDYQRTTANAEEEESPFKDVLLTGNQDPIRWASEQSETLLGLASEVRNYTRNDGSGVLAPGQNQTSRQAGRGSAFVQPVAVDDVTFYVQAGKRIVRGLTNNYERGVFAAPDMTREAEHVTKGGIIQMAFQLNRVSTLYCVTGDGHVACLIFDPEIEKMGWYRLKSQNGHIESVAVLPTTGEEDSVFFVVRREIDGNTVRYIERLKNDQVRIQDDGLVEDMFYVDCGGSATGTNLQVIQNLQHLEGETVQVLGDGDYLGEFTVTGGEVDTGTTSDKLTWGIPMKAELWPMPLEGVTAAGTTSGAKKRVKEITLDLFQSLGFYSLPDPESTDDPYLLTKRRTADDLESAPALFTGKAEVRQGLPRSFDGNVYYFSEEPFGVFIRNIITKWEQTSQ